MISDVSSGWSMDIFRYTMCRYFRSPIIIAIVWLTIGGPLLPAAYAQSRESAPTNPPAASGNSMQPIATKVAEFEDVDNVVSLQFSPDGRQLAVSFANHLPVHIWEWQRRPRIVSRFSKPPGTGWDAGGSADGLRYSPDGNLLAVSHQRASEKRGLGAVRIFDVKGGGIVHDVRESTGGLFSRIEFSPDGKSFIRTYDRAAQFPGNTLIVHRTDTWETVWGLNTNPLGISAMAVSADGKTVAIAGRIYGPGVVHRSSLVVVSLEQRKAVLTIDDAFPPENWICVLAWHPDGNHLAAGVRTGEYAGAFRVFDIRTGEQISEEKPPEYGDVPGLRYTLDGRYLIAAGVRRSVEIWDAAHHHLLQEIGPVEPMSNIAISRDSSHFAFGDQDTVQVWTLQ